MQSEYEVHVYDHGAFILTHGVEVRDSSGAVVWRNLYSSENEARQAGQKKADALMAKHSTKD